MNKKPFISLFSILIIAPLLTFGQTTYSFLNKGSIFDGETKVQEVSGALTITIGANGGVFNSNQNNFGIGDTRIDGQNEIISLSFSQAVEITFIDFSSVGSDVGVGAKITTNGTPALDLDLYTGVLDFHGSTDIYTPTIPIRLNAGETISFKGSGANSSFEIHNLQYQVIPEMSVQSMTTGALSLTLVLLSRLLP